MAANDPHARHLLSPEDAQRELATGLPVLRVTASAVRRLGQAPPSSPFRQPHPHCRFGLIAVAPAGQRTSLIRDRSTNILKPCHWLRLWTRYRPAGPCLVGRGPGERAEHPLARRSLLSRTELSMTEDPLI